MRRFLLLLISLPLYFSCSKAVKVEVPEFSEQLAVEMYLEDGKPLRCLITEVVPYTDTAMNKPSNELEVILDNGMTRDTLIQLINHDYETGRVYNYFNPRRLVLDSLATYNLHVQGRKFNVKARTRVSQSPVFIDSIDIKHSSAPNRYSVGVQFQDPQASKDFYKFIITKRLNDFYSEAAEEIMSDLAFNGKRFSIYTEPIFEKNDSIVVRVYALTEEHYNFLVSAKEARRSVFNTFSQPAQLRTNIEGGVGIFTTIRYSERKVLVR